MEVGMLEAKNRLSELVDRAQKGEKVTITRRGEPAVQLTPIHRKPTREELELLVAEVREERRKMPLYTEEQYRRDREEGRPE